MKRHQVWQRVTGWGGRTLSPTQIELLEDYRGWLISEGRVTGGIGPAEIDRVDTRHIGDSLLFAGVLSHDPDLVADIGSGVGLPGIPLAILMSNTSFHLVDRSGRRVDLLGRVVGILDLPNVSVTQGEIADLGQNFPVIVSRATLSPVEATDQLRRRLDPGGVAVLGGSWIECPAYPDWDTVSVPAEILDHEVWILIMRRP